MIAIVSRGCPLSSGFFVDSDEATALVLFSKYFGVSDVFIFDSVTRDRADRLDYYNVKKFLSKKQFSNFIKSISSGASLSQYPQEKIF